MKAQLNPCIGTNHSTLADNVVGENDLVRRFSCPGRAWLSTIHLETKKDLDPGNLGFSIKAVERQGGDQG
jgi:hypothetical protein